MKVWTFCSHCKLVEEVEVDRFYLEFGILPKHKHGSGEIGLQVYNTKEQAEFGRKKYIEPKFGMSPVINALEMLKIKESIKKSIDKLFAIDKKLIGEHGTKRPY